MRANYRLQRLFVDERLAEGLTVGVSPEQAHYLAHVLRLAAGAELLVFNGRDGEWLARIAAIAKKAVTLTLVETTRPQQPQPDLVFCFAPIKAGRLDWLVQRATEMGAGILQPVITQHAQVRDPGLERLRANVMEAAEQCGVLAVPEVRETVKLEKLLAGWDRDRRLIFADEDSSTDNPLPALRAISATKLGILVGPEGGFSDDEREMLRALPFVTPIPLGPRILRADTAAIAALAIVQAVKGDW
ncbi:MAG: 16S rRNA (uracil(1498)-N(3))-methyltransferase [Phyllobacteriaceae bacterium]|nr:16S rRNA (uracil(1498)-N(3))-methyltransferase [Phyllobacteriaceae bacterium]